MKFVQQRQTRPGDAMVPLINVVFLLVIFFMLAGVMEASPPFPVAVPETQQEVEAEKGKATVFLSDDGDIAMSGGIEGVEQVVAHLQSLHEDKSTVKVLVQADARAPFENLKVLTQALHRAGFANISLLAAAGAE